MAWISRNQRLLVRSLGFMLALLADQAELGHAAGATVRSAAATSSTVGASWAQLTPQGDIPYGFGDYVMTEGPDNTCFVFSGTWGYAFGSNDVYQIGVDGRWKKIPSQQMQPSPRYSSAGVYDAPGQRMVIFGGMSCSYIPPLMVPYFYYYNDTWAMDAKTGAWTVLTTQGTPPDARCQHTAVFDSLRRRMVVFGGTPTVSGYTVLKDFYALDLATLTWSRLQPAGAVLPYNFDKTAAYLPDRDILMFLCRYVDSTSGLAKNEVYQLSFAANTITRLATTGMPSPAPRDTISFYDPRTQRFFIFCGDLVDGSQKTCLYALNLQTNHWDAINTGSPAPAKRDACQIRMIASPDKFLLFGGHNYTGYLSDSWLLTLGQPVPVRAAITDFLAYE